MPAFLGATAAGSFGGSGAARELVWPQLGEPRKAQFKLRDGKEQEL